MCLFSKRSAARALIFAAGMRRFCVGDRVGDLWDGSTSTLYTVSQLRRQARHHEALERTTLASDSASLYDLHSG